jgi:hypothetical protein
MYYAEFQGVYFVEGSPTGAVSIGSVSTELNGFFSQNQLKSLDDVKIRLCALVRERGGNAVIDFKYGQRSTFLKGLFGMDNVMWYASGMIARVDLSTNPTDQSPPPVTQSLIPCPSPTTKR